MPALALCSEESCYLPADHVGNHKPQAPRAWSFLKDKDRKKIVKAGFATPRGGDKGAYQNHVVRSNKVIIPYEKMKEMNLRLFVDGYVVRLFPDQYFESARKPRKEFTNAQASVKVGENAFVLYRTWDSYKQYPPLKGWKVRSLAKDHKKVAKRGKGVADKGEFVLRMPRIGPNPERNKGYPQGLFAPEYADTETNFLCQALLAWLITRTLDNPYDGVRLDYLEAVLNKASLLNETEMERNGIVRDGKTSCPLCSRKIRYSELHAMLELSDATSALLNAPEQVLGATRSTSVNLFHFKPLGYRSLEHAPQNIAWGHHVCNTALGQHECVPMAKLKATGVKLVTADKADEAFAWISRDREMMRSDDHSVWIRIA